MSTGKTQYPKEYIIIQRADFRPIPGSVSYNAKAVYGIVALKYRSVFPVPTHPYLKSRICGLRLDRILPARINCLSRPKTKVTNNWLAYIREWIRFYATGKLVETQLSTSRRKQTELLDTARTLLLEELSKRKIGLNPILHD